MMMTKSVFFCLCLSTFIVGAALAGQGVINYRAAQNTLSQDDPSVMNGTQQMMANGTGEGCYDMSVHKCDCTGLTKESCEETGGIFTAECACATDGSEAAGEDGETNTDDIGRRMLLQQAVVGALQTGANAVTDAITNPDNTTASDSQDAPSDDSSSSVEEDSSSSSNVTEQIPSGQGTISEPLPTGLGCLNETNQECNCTANITKDSCESTGGLFTDQCACTPDGPDQRQVYTNFSTAGDEITMQEGEGRRRLSSIPIDLLR
jgi:hypothetical protein